MQTDLFCPTAAMRRLTDMTLRETAMMRWSTNLCKTLFIFTFLKTVLWFVSWSFDLIFKLYWPSAFSLVCYIIFITQWTHLASFLLCTFNGWSGCLRQTYRPTSIIPVDNVSTQLLSSVLSISCNPYLLVLCFSLNICLMPQQPYTALSFQGL